ncbi:MAG: glycoside hydrolase family 3 C-terminal domain-containing protein, partial [Nocardioidaceae bacterium]|nr:glycoside hydrolase family 3 C-terminal domain-containing protein [Nocardioidaceae bacterium]
GLVMSDWAAVSERWRGLLAGLDLEMPSSDGLFDEETLAAIAGGRLPRDRVAASAQRVIDLVDRSPLTPTGGLPVDEHDALALRVATEGTVLLANDGLLPLRGAEAIALIGAFAEQPRFQGAGSSLVNAVRVTTAREALAARGATVTFEAGYDAERSGNDPALIARAAEAARRADVAVIMVGLPTTHESEGFDRVTLALPAQHDALVAAVAAANPRTVVALSNGAPVLMPWREDVAAIVESYVGGQASGAALVSVLFGDAEPGGRLAETFPASLEDVASDPWFPGRTRQVQHREGLFVGYRHHVTTGIAPLFPFGHGLGYTTFAWSDASLDRAELSPGQGATVTVTVTNTGDRAGSDVVQVYLADRSGVVLRPERQLAGFAKVRLDPGASTLVSVEVAARAFQFYDVEASGWLTPDGPFELIVARSSADVEARLPGRVVGGVTTAAEPADTPAISGSAAEFERRLRRPVPAVPATRPFTRNSTIDELSATRVGRALRRVLLAAAVEGIPEDDTATRLMFQRGVEELPLRAAAIFSEGRIRLPAVDAILALANRDARGLGGVAGASLRRLGDRLRR